jgi:hypothetical protein
LLDAEAPSAPERHETFREVDELAKISVPGLLAQHRD